MPNNGNGRNRSREGSFRNWDEYENRSGANRNSGYQNEYGQNKNEGSYSSRGGYNPGSESGRGTRSSGQGSRNYDYNDEGSMSNSNYDRSRGSFDTSSDMTRGTGSEGQGSSSGNRNSGNRDYGRSGYGGYQDRSNENGNRENDRDWWDKTRDEVSSWFGDDDAQRRRNRDEQKGQHSGKGPKGYTRSDDRIKEDINDRLSDDSQVDASEIDVTVNSCEVTLTGTVNTRWEKRRAEDIVEAVSGVKNVENRLRVSSSANTSQGSETGGVMGKETSSMGNGKTTPQYSSDASGSRHN